jgi:mannose-1-phosphate guanylyltransferase
MLRLTFERLQGLVPPERTWVVTSAAAAQPTRELLPEVPAGNVLGEPAARDTAACVGFAAQVLRHHDPGAVCVVLPADHEIGEPEQFRAAMAAGMTQVEREGGLLTFGIEPRRPETGYGYLRLGAPHGSIDEFNVFHLRRFVEKPDLEKARDYVASGSYLWNSGMFAWRASAVLEEIGRQLPRLAAGLAQIAASLGTSDQDRAIGEIYPTLQRISIDYGVMEGAEQVWVMPVSLAWSDVGSWPSLGELLPTDGQGNACRGRVLALTSRSNVLYSEGPVVAVIGLDDVIAVATGDAVLLAPRSEAQRVRQLVESLERKGWDDVL